MISKGAETVQKYKYKTMTIKIYRICRSRNKSPVNFKVMLVNVHNLTHLHTLYYQCGLELPTFSRVICSSVFSLNCENKTEHKKIESKINVWSQRCKKENQTKKKI
jgi:hypothetical protein